MRHRANPKFWQFHAQLPEEIQRLADDNYELLKADPRHPSLHLKRLAGCGLLVSVSNYRAVAVEDGADIVWFCIGHHSEYDEIIAGHRK